MSENSGLEHSLGVKTPYCEVNKQVVDRLIRHNSGITLSEIREFILWLFTMDVLPPSWVFVGNKPFLQNVTLLNVYEEEISDLPQFRREFAEITEIPIRKPSIPDIWDQYILFAVQNVKRSRADIDPSLAHRSYISMCLTKEERKENNYTTYDNEEQKEKLINDGYLIVEYATVPEEKEITENCLIGIDCEMVEVSGDHDAVARVSIVSSKGVILDEYIHPEEVITDYRTLYSGITPALMCSCTNTFYAIQKRVYSILSKKNVIVVGHSAENDLNILKIIHPYVIDTAVRYLNPVPTHKYSLRSLATKYLSRSIQGGVNGHNSCDDAIAARDLAIYFMQHDCSYDIYTRKPKANRSSCLLQRIAEANSDNRVVMIGSNDYILSISQMATSGDMLTMNKKSVLLSKMEGLSKNRRIPRFIYIHGIQYEFASVGATKTTTIEPMPLIPFIQKYKECFQNGLLCINIMKKDMTVESTLCGHFYVTLSTYLCFLINTSIIHNPVYHSRSEG